MRDDLPSVSQINWLPVYNNSGETIPAFAPMRISGMVASTFEFSVSKPNANDAVSNILFNGPVEIPSGSYGMATADMPATVRYDTADGTPSNGDEWGVASGGWYLKNARAGFLIQGVIDSSNGVATAAPNMSGAAGGGSASTNILLDGSNHTDTVSHTVVLGDMIYGDGTPEWTALAGQITTSLNVLTQTGTGSASAAPVWQPLTGTGVLFWQKFTLDYATVVAATSGSSGTTTVTIYTLPAKGVIHAVVLKTSIKWVEGISPVTEDVGVTGTDGKFMNSIAVDTTVSDTNYTAHWPTSGTAGVGDIESFASTTAVTSTIHTLDNSAITAGSTDIWLLLSVLP